MSEGFDVPIALIIFNRPDLTTQVFERIRAARPTRLFVIADGPRREDEREVCDLTRAIATNVDWDCVVQTNFTDANLGCGKRVASGLNWLFEQCEEAIIFEDDCIPNPTFFPYCAELLEKYRDDERVAMISGDNFLHECTNVDASLDSYGFSQFALIWGWATWRRAWKNFDFEMKDWPALKSAGWLDEAYGRGKLSQIWCRNFDRVYYGVVDTWDAQWQYAILRQKALVIQPTVNLISNVGFGDAATHTKTANKQAFLDTVNISFPLRHPAIVARDANRDEQTFETIHLPTLVKRSLLQRIVGRLRRLASPMIQRLSPTRSNSPV